MLVLRYKQKTEITVVPQNNKRCTQSERRRTGKSVSSPNNNDEAEIANLKYIGQWPVAICDSPRKLLVRQGSAAVAIFGYQFCNCLSTKGELRKPTVKKLYGRRWRTHHQNCRFAANYLEPLAFSSEISSKIEEHESTQIHLVTFEKWKNLEVVLRHGLIKLNKKFHVRKREDERKVFAKTKFGLREHQEVEDDSRVSDRGQGQFLQRGAACKMLLSDSRDMVEKERTSQIFCYIKIDGTSVRCS
ncbi:hypothetical protein FQR65_LT19446 [Abscondita terminalis]|nr:hypothetical protein FQR65_LT19446 [Abscondita terminalis]